jgi:hypothetical protein
MVQVNSAQRSSGTTSNFSIDFLTRDLDKVVAVTMIKATLPRLFFNIQSWNNRINIIHPAATNNFFTVPPGQYTITSLTAALNAATAGIFVSWVYHTATSRLEATYSSVTTVTLDSSTLSTIAPYIGLTQDIVLGLPTELTSPPQLSGLDEVIIKSNLVAATSMVAAGETSAKSVIGNINFTNVPYGFTGRMDCNNLNIAQIAYNYQTCMRKIDIQLVDVFDHEVELPENCFLDMTLQFSY